MQTDRLSALRANIEHSRILLPEDRAFWLAHIDMLSDPQIAALEDIFAREKKIKWGEELLNLDTAARNATQQWQQVQNQLSLSI